MFSYVQGTGVSTVEGENKIAPHLIKRGIQPASHKFDMLTLLPPFYG